MGIKKESTTLDWDDIFGDDERWYPVDKAIKNLQELKKELGKSLRCKIHYDWDYTFLDLRWEREETEKETAARLKKEEARRKGMERKRLLLEEQEKKELKRLKDKYESLD